MLLCSKKWQVQIDVPAIAISSWGSLLVFRLNYMGTKLTQCSTTVFQFMIRREFHSSPSKQILHRKSV